MKAQTTIRLILSAVIIYFVYQETGIATTVFAVLVTIAIELQSMVQKAQKKLNDITATMLNNAVNLKDAPENEKSKWQQRLEEKIDE